MKTCNKHIITTLSLALCAAILTSNAASEELPEADQAQEQVVVVGQQDDTVIVPLAASTEVAPPITHNLSIRQLQQALLLLDEDLADTEDEEEIAVIAAKRERVIAALKAMGGSTDYSGVPGLLNRKDKADYSSYYIAGGIVTIAALVVFCMSSVEKDERNGAHFRQPSTLILKKNVGGWCN